MAGTYVAGALEVVGVMESSVNFLGSGTGDSLNVMKPSGIVSLLRLISNAEKQVIISLRRLN